MAQHISPHYETKSSCQESNLPWVEKYRPKRLSELFLPAHTKEAITKLVACGDAIPHLLLVGPPGTGKTTVAKILVNAIFSSAPRTLLDTNVLNMNASDERGIETMRDIVREFACPDDTRPRITSILNPGVYSHPLYKFRMVIMDECDALTYDAQAMLRTVIEDSTIYCRFIFLCNNVSKMIDPLVSRCRLIRFEKLDDASIVACLARVVAHEKLLRHFSANDIVSLVETCKGDVRQAINHLQLVSVSSANKDGAVGHAKTMQKHIFGLVNRLPPSEVEEILTLTSTFHNPPTEEIASRVINLFVQLSKSSVNIGSLIEDLCIAAQTTFQEEESLLVYYVTHLAAIQVRLAMNGSAELALLDLLTWRMKQPISE